MIAHATRFPPEDRRLLLSAPRIGPLVVERLEAMGIGSLGELRRLGVDRIVQSICDLTGNGAWANRRGALQRALQLAERDGG